MSKVLYDKRDEIAYITLNRPEVHNAIDREADELLREAWTDFREDPEIRLAIPGSRAGSRAACTAPRNRSSRLSTAG
jgi:enoyl-CoA hydratase/carnithine racemase